MPRTTKIQRIKARLTAPEVIAFDKFVKEMNNGYTAFFKKIKGDNGLEYNNFLLLTPSLLTITRNFLTSFSKSALPVDELRQKIRQEKNRIVFDKIISHLNKVASNIKSAVRAKKGEELNATNCYLLNHDFIPIKKIETILDPEYMVKSSGASHGQGGKNKTNYELYNGMARDFVMGHKKVIRWLNKWQEQNTHL